MRKEFKEKLYVFGLIIVGIIFIQVISNYSKNKINIDAIKNDVEPTKYGDVYYNYQSKNLSGKDLKPSSNSNIQELVIEEFTQESINTHRKCPVMENSDTKITTCVQIPNTSVNGLPPGDISKGFIVSTCCSGCVNMIQNSLNNDGNYKIEFENDHYVLKKNNVVKQVLYDCTEDNIKKIIDKIDTTLLNPSML